MSCPLSRLAYRIDAVVEHPDRLPRAAMAASAALTLAIAIAFGEPMQAPWWQQALLLPTAIALLAAVLFVPVLIVLWMALRLAEAALMVASLLLAPFIALGRALGSRSARARP